MLPPRLLFFSPFPSKQGSQYLTQNICFTALELQFREPKFNRWQCLEAATQASKARLVSWGSSKLLPGAHGRASKWFSATPESVSDMQYKVILLIQKTRALRNFSPWFQWGLKFYSNFTYILQSSSLWDTLLLMMLGREKWSLNFKN